MRASELLCPSYYHVAFPAHLFERNPSKPSIFAASLVGADYDAMLVDGNDKSG